MRYIFEPSDIKAGALFYVQWNCPRMIIKQPLSSAESELERQYAMLDLINGDVLSPWMTQEKLAEYLNINLSRPLTRAEVFVSDAN